MCGIWGSFRSFLSSDPSSQCWIASKIISLGQRQRVWKVATYPHDSNQASICLYHGSISGQKESIPCTRSPGGKAFLPSTCRALHGKQPRGSPPTPNLKGLLLGDPSPGQRIWSRLGSRWGFEGLSGHWPITWTAALGDSPAQSSQVPRALDPISFKHSRPWTHPSET